MALATPPAERTAPPVYRTVLVLLGSSAPTTLAQNFSHVEMGLARLPREKIAQLVRKIVLALRVRGAMWEPVRHSINAAIQNVTQRAEKTAAIVLRTVAAPVGRLV